MEKYTGIVRNWFDHRVGFIIPDVSNDQCQDLSDVFVHRTSPQHFNSLETGDTLEFEYCWNYKVKPWMALRGNCRGQTL